MSKLKTLVNFVLEQQKNLLAPSTYEARKNYLKKLVVFADEKGIEEPCQDLYDSYIARATTPDLRFQLFHAVRLVDKAAGTKAFKRTKETAQLLFGDREVTVTPFLDEVPLRSFRDTGKSYPLRVWNAMGRIQWFLGNGRQKETRQETKERAVRLIRMLMEKDEDCILISHGWFMQVLLRELGSAGFVAKRGSLIHIAPLERIVFTEKALHCGNCMHNCLLSNPGCAIGKEKAIAKGLISR